MRAIIAKEMRELLKWAAFVLAVVGIGTFLIFAMDDIREVLFYWAEHCVAMTTIAAAAGGLLLGIMSTVFEARADRWAFLVHRPLSRTSIFLGKAAAGLALLYLAVGIPFAASIAWCASSGFWAAPFRPGLAVPWMVDILAGGIYFLAGMTIGLRRSRWYGSKVFPLGFPLLATALMWMVPHLWQAVLILLAALAVSGAAAWGTFLAGGEPRPQPRIARAAMAVHLFSGACPVAGLVFAIVVLLICELTLKREEWPASTYVQPLFLRDGSVMLATHHPDRTVTVTDPEGKVLGAYPDYDAFSKTVPHEEEILLSGLAHHGFPISPFYFRGYRNPARFHRIVKNDGTEFWCFSMRDGIIRGYDLEKKRPIGYLGAGGFSPPAGGLPAPFPGVPSTEGFGLSNPLAFSGGIFRIDFPERNVAPLFTPAAGERVLDEASLMARVGGLHSGCVVQGIAVLTGSSVRVLEPSNAKEIMAVSLPFDPEAFRLLRVGMPSSNRRLIVQALYPRDTRGASPDHVFVFDADGALAMRFEVPEYRPPAMRTLRREERVLAVLGGPAWILGNKAVLAWIGEGLGYFPLGKTWPFLLVPSLLCALVALALARRESMRRGRTAAWIATAFVLGLPGLLTLLSLDPRATLVSCPACSTRRPVERDLCPRCAAPFPAPARDGTEIIAEA